ncbi:MAG TPA: GFA family protein [Caulobacteraceae bacterium]|nr:GFA family protein [Caulobacteraceae bacterium]
MSDPPTRRARCACGDLWIEVEGEPSLNAVCFCDNCKQRTGSAFGWSCYFRDDQVKGRGGAASAYRIEKPEFQAERRFCRRCGSTLTWTVSIYPGVTGVAGGCFAPGEIGGPTGAASNHGRFDWLALPEHWAVIGSD